MSQAITMKVARGSSPRLLARVVGALYLLTLVAGVFAQGYVSDRLIDWGSAAATASHIVTHRSLYLWGLTVYLVEMMCSVATTALFYVLMRPAGRTVALVAAFLGLVASTIKTVGRVFFIVPLFLLGGGHAFHAIGQDAMGELALVLLMVNDHAAGIAMAFFGIYSILAGYLVLRSTFLPRILGVPSILAGLGWLTYLSPPTGYRLFPYLVTVALLGALAKIFWLLVFGVNEQRWHEQAGLGRP